MFIWVKEPELLFTKAYWIPYLKLRIVEKKSLSLIILVP
jgi:hypothetical protein